MYVLLNVLPTECFQKFHSKHSKHCSYNWDSIHKSKHITPVFQDSHWLPVSKHDHIICIKFHLKELSLNGCAPRRISDTFVEPVHSFLWLMIHIKLLLTKYKAWWINCSFFCFFFAASRLWNYFFFYISIHQQQLWLFSKNFENTSYA